MLFYILMSWPQYPALAQWRLRTRAFNVVQWTGLASAVYDSWHCTLLIPFNLICTCHSKDDGLFLVALKMCEAEPLLLICMESVSHSRTSDRRRK
mmetsp:Transcript_11850/g.26766  ORF Transcript_11850/g.26766 Transcript_11850/m.26766 type:complete len:95 (-) Transcript_11850:157-441(-)